MKNPEEYVKKYSELFIYDLKETTDLIRQVQKDVLESVIEHPTKPGYRRRDVLDKLKQLENE